MPDTSPVHPARPDALVPLFSIRHHAPTGPLDIDLQHEPLRGDVVIISSVAPADPYWLCEEGRKLLDQLVAVAKTALVDRQIGSFWMATRNWSDAEMTAMVQLDITQRAAQAAPSEAPRSRPISNFPIDI